MPNLPDGDNDRRHSGGFFVATVVGMQRRVRPTDAGKIAFTTLTRYMTPVPPGS
jgi:hypothetical protein